MVKTRDKVLLILVAVLIIAAAIIGPLFFAYEHSYDDAFQIDKSSNEEFLLHFFE